MNRIFCWLLGIACCVLNLYSCKSSTTTTSELLTLDLSGNKVERKLRFEDLGKEICILPLETKEESVLPNDFVPWIGEKYLIVASRDALLQFDMNGKFVRTIALKGRGPGEFVRINAMTVDEENDRLYYIDSANQGIFVYDLKEGKSLKTIETEHARAQYLYMSEGGVLNGIALNEIPAKYRFFSVTADGVVLDTLRKPWFEFLDFTGMVNPSHIVLLQDGIHFHTSYSDTLFTLKDGKIAPFCKWKTEEELKSVETNQTGTVVRVIFESEEFLCLRKLKWEKETLQDGERLTQTTLENYIVDKRNWEIKQLIGFDIDLLKFSLPFLEKIQIAGKKLCIIWGAIKFKENVKEHLDQLSPEIKQLYEQLTDESNPVLIMATPS